MNVLECYDANGELSVIRKWFNMITTPLDKAQSIDQLHKEAKNTTGKPGSRMLEYLQRATDSTKSEPGLTRAECLAVLMYTDDNDARAFFNEYNKASRERKWEPYRIYTTLLTSALRKLAESNPLPPSTHLYRGLGSRLGPPTARRLFWKSFTSTSLDYETARDNFAGSDGIILKFEPPVSYYAAQVGQLSTYLEDEVILLPFEAFDFMGAIGQEFSFKTSKAQELFASFHAQSESSEMPSYMHSAKYL